MEVDAKQMKKIAWLVYKVAGPVLFGKAGPEKLRRTCAKLRVIAGGGKLPGEIAEELQAQIAEVERSALDAREAFEKWYMGRFGSHIAAHFRDAKNARHISSQTSSSLHFPSLRQQVEGEGCFSGKSCQRAPVRNTHKIPSRQARLSAHGLPRLLSLGSSGSILLHCLSLR